MGLFVLETDPEGFLTEGISSSESVLSTCTEARGMSIHGQINRGVFESNSTTSEAVGLFVAVICQHDFSNVSLQKKLVIFFRFTRMLPRYCFFAIEIKEIQ